MPNKQGDWTGTKNPRWKGGRYVDSRDGYAYLQKPDHPNADKRGYVREHVFIMSEQLGRPIGKNEVVHHINDMPGDNRPENLQVMLRGAHHSHHHKGLKKPNSLAALRPNPHTLSPMTSAKANKMWSGPRAHERMQPKVCDACGTQFYRAGKGQYTHVYCSQSCYHAHKKAMAQY